MHSPDTNKKGVIESEMVASIRNSDAIMPLAGWQPYKKYPHSFGYFLRFLIADGAERSFVDGTWSDDSLEYIHRDVGLLKSLQVSLVEDEKRDVDDAARAFLQRRRREIELLIAQEALWHDSSQTKAFHQANAALFNAPRQEVFNLLLKRLKGDTPHEVSDNFNMNIKTLQQVCGKRLQAVRYAVRTQPTIIDAANYLLQWSELAQEWSVHYDSKRRGATVAPKTRQLILGEASLRANERSKIGILAHELTHIWRAQGGDKTAGDPAFEEGIAFLMERLARGSAPSIARFWRYLAIGLSHGFDGKGLKNAKEVYDILLPLYTAHTKREEKQAQHYIFGTVMRVWQGSPPSVRGAAIFRDTIYAEGSMRVKQLFDASLIPPERMRYIMSNKVTQ